MSTVADSLAALREPEFRKLFFGQATSVVGVMFTVVALPFAVLEIGGTATDIGIVEAANLVPLAVFLLVGGVWADRLPRQKVMLVADFLRFALQCTTAALLISGVAEVWHLALLQVGMGVCEAFFRPAAMGLTPQVVSERAPPAGQRAQQPRDERVHHSRSGVRRPPGGGRRSRLGHRDRRAHLSRQRLVPAAPAAGGVSRPAGAGRRGRRPRSRAGRSRGGGRRRDSAPVPGGPASSAT